MDILTILVGFGWRKTKPNKANLFSPQHCWGLKNLFEKTKPIYRWAKLAQSLIWKEIMVINGPVGHEKTKPIRQERIAGEGLFGKMGDTGLEPVTSCVSSTLDKML